MTEEERRLLADLSRQPGWELLVKVANEAKDAEYAKLTRELLAGRRPTQAEVSYVRGYFRGLMFLINNPTLEANAIERARKDVK